MEAIAPFLPSFSAAQAQAPSIRCARAGQGATNLVEQFLQFLLSGKGASRYTLKSYRADLIQFGHFLSGKIGRGSAQPSPFSENIDENLLQCAAATVVDFQSYLEDQNYSNSSIARKLAALRGFYKFLIRREMVSVNPLSTIRPPRQEMRSPQCLDPRQVRMLLDAPGYGSLLCARDSAILELLYSTGIRVSEMVDLTVPDLNLPAAVIHIRGHSPIGRFVPISPEAIHAIERYSQMRARQCQLRPQPCDRLFLNTHGRPLSTRSVRRKLDKYLAAAGLATNISPSTLRHTFAVQLLIDGVQLHRVQELLGLRNLSSAQIYHRLAARNGAEHPPAVTSEAVRSHRPRAA